jgi:hypothetical protein
MLEMIIGSPVITADLSIFAETARKGEIERIRGIAAKTWGVEPTRVSAHRIIGHDDGSDRVEMSLKRA